MSDDQSTRLFLPSLYQGTRSDIAKCVAINRTGARREQVSTSGNNDYQDTLTRPRWPTSDLTDRGCEPDESPGLRRLGCGARCDAMRVARGDANSKPSLSPLIVVIPNRPFPSITFL